MIRKLRLILYKSINAKHHDISPKNHTRTPLFEIKKLWRVPYAEHKPSEDNGITVTSDLVFAKLAIKKIFNVLWIADLWLTISQTYAHHTESTEYTLESSLIFFYKNNINLWNLLLYPYHSNSME